MRIFIILLLVSVAQVWSTPIEQQKIQKEQKEQSKQRSTRRTAYAILHYDDDIWGSVVFHQWSKTTPVIISLLFQNIKIQAGQKVGFAIHDEPVHYDQFSESKLCAPASLKSVLNVDGIDIGHVSQRHRMITTRRFSDVMYDEKLSLFEDNKANIIGKSFVIRQGGDVAQHRCATIYLSKLESQRPGAVPCELRRYPDCLVGAHGVWDKCVFKPCIGFRRFWGTVDRNTLMCKQVFNSFPKLSQKIVTRKGLVKCVHGNHTLLKPIGLDAEL